MSEVASSPRPIAMKRIASEAMLSVSNSSARHSISSSVELKIGQRRDNAHH